MNSIHTIFQIIYTWTKMKDILQLQD